MSWFAADIPFLTLENVQRGYHWLITNFKHFLWCVYLYTLYTLWCSRQISRSWRDIRLLTPENVGHHWTGDDSHRIILSGSMDRAGRPHPLLRVWWHSPHYTRNETQQQWYYVNRNPDNISLITCHKWTMKSQTEHCYIAWPPLDAFIMSLSSFSTSLMASLIAPRRLERFCLVLLQVWYGKPSYLSPADSWWMHVTVYLLGKFLWQGGH